MKFQILFSKAKSPEENMTMDLELLRSLEFDSMCTLHFYRWNEIAATYGYFLNPYDYFRKKSFEEKKIAIARRPTGGGIIFHHCDLAFSVVLPTMHSGFSLNTLENYAFINSAVSQAIFKYAGIRPVFLEHQTKNCDSLSDFCMAQPTVYDVMINSKKIAGGAQRRTKYGYLHQGTIALSLPDESFLTSHLINGAAVAEKMHTEGFSLERLTGSEVSCVRKRLISHLIDEFLFIFNKE